MTDFEDQLDEIRARLYEDTKDMTKKELITAVNAHAQTIAREFGITIATTLPERSAQPVIG